MNWTGEDWLIVFGIAAWVALVVLWLIGLRVTRRVDPDEHEALGIGAITTKRETL